MIACNESGSYDWDYGYVVVVLPSGCSSAGTHDSSVFFAETHQHGCDSLSDWGLFGKAEAMYYMDFAYSSGAWVCQITYVYAIVGDQILTASYSGAKNVSAASDVPCSDVTRAIYELTDTTPNNDRGAPWNHYWSFDATVAHEHRHMADWKSYYGTYLASAIAAAEAISVPISSAATCQDAATLKGADVAALLHGAYTSALAAYDNPATTLHEDEQRAYESENAVLVPILSDLPGGCTP